MDNTNRIISFVLGLVVVIVFLAVITGRFKLNTLKFLSLPKKTVVTPTITPTAKNTNIGSVATNSQSTNTTYQSNSGSKSTINEVKSIPNTGAPTLFLPIALSSLFGGIFLRKKGK